MKTKAIAVILLVGIFLLPSCRKEKNRVCELYDGEVGYTIGSIDSYSTVPFKAVYEYSFTIAGIGYNGKEKEYGIGQGSDQLLGLEFIVVYSLNDPNNSDLNNDFLIEDEADFITFLNDYENSPPPPDYPNKCN